MGSYVCSVVDIFVFPPSDILPVYYLTIKKGRKHLELFNWVVVLIGFHKKDLVHKTNLTNNYGI